MGTRGVPAMYGGFETMAAELSQRLAAIGHDVTVYCRIGRTDESSSMPPGVTRRFLPYLPGKYLETVSHTALSVFDSLLHPYDVVFVANAANAILTGFPRLRGSRVVLNVDGIERQRAKWGLVGRLWYTFGERFALVFPDEIVSDAAVIQAYYLNRYGRRTALITYGAKVLPREPIPDLERLGLAGIFANDYFLYVSRLEPENQALLVVEAYKRVGGSHSLLIVGDALYSADYKAELERTASSDPRIRLVGGIYGDGYADLQRGALAYIQATSVGGTHPALIEAMAAGNLVLAFASPENIEVTSGSALLFNDASELAAHLSWIVGNRGSAEYRRLKEAALSRAVRNYSWEAITRQYDELFRSLANRKR